MNWINAKDAMPEEDEIVLVCFRNRGGDRYELCAYLKNLRSWYSGNYYYPEDCDDIFWTRDYRMV